MASSVRLIPATVHLPSTHRSQHLVKRRTAAYARVSTDSEEQLTSYEAQVDYYTKYIKDRADWEFAGIYTDEGISAVNTKKRDGFNKMVADALAGKFDLIVTKSVSRFARNTVDSLSTVRKLKEKGVEVFFEKENIYTFDGKGELLITIMSSLAQEESRSISENVTWGQRKRFADGKVSMPYKRFLGYEKGEDGVPKIVEEEAKLVRRIYRLFMEGKTPSFIANRLTQEGIKTPGGKDKWQVATINSILQNEKYKGDALLQKRFTVDFLTKKTKDNEGEVPQYYVANSHPAIIEPDEFDIVQAEIQRRKKLGRPMACQSPFAAKIVCEECGGYFGPKVWGSNTKYRKVIWRCNNKYAGGSKCQTPHVTEEQLRASFVEAFNSVLAYREAVLSDLALARDMLCDVYGLDKEIGNCQEKMEVLAVSAKNAIMQSAIIEGSEAEREKYISDYIEAEKEVMVLMAKREELIAKSKVLDEYIRVLKSQSMALKDFDEQLFFGSVERIVVREDGRMSFCLKDESEVTI